MWWSVLVFAQLSIVFMWVKLFPWGIKRFLCKNSPSALNTSNRGFPENLTFCISFIQFGRGVMGNSNHFASESTKYSQCMEGIKIEVSFFIYIYTSWVSTIFIWGLHSKKDNLERLSRKISMMNRILKELCNLKKNRFNTYFFTLIFMSSLSNQAYTH